MAKAKKAIHQPLLTASQVAECIRLGQHWPGSGIPWPMRETRQGNSGNLVSQKQGSGIDYSETRPYQPGDEPRHMNWRATARTGRPQVRVFQQDLTPVSYFLIDRRSTMRFATRRRLKVTQAARLAIFLASQAARDGSELGSLIIDEALQWQPPISGQDGLYQLAQLVSKPCPPLHAAPKITMQRALSQLAGQIPPGSHLYLLSDFFDLEDDLQPWLYQLGEQHRVWAIDIHDPAEQHLPDAGLLQLVWDQVSMTNIINTSDENIGQLQQARFERRQQQLKKVFERAGISYSCVLCDQDDIGKALQAETS